MDAPSPPYPSSPATDTKGENAGSTQSSVLSPQSSIIVGHWTDTEARTGCTVILFDHPVLAAVEIRGGAPGTRETDLLAPDRLVQRADAILLTGGSAFGLAAADGVVRYLADHGRGFPTSAGPVPIVPAAVLFDLAVGKPVSPDANAGVAACKAAYPLHQMERGQVGAGVGATTGKLTNSTPAPGGIGLGECPWSGGLVTAIVAVNAAGDVLHPPNRDPLPSDRREAVATGADIFPAFGESTTLAVIIVDGPCNHLSLSRCAIAGHDGLARAIRPAHTIFDGDIVFATSLSEGSLPPPDILRLTLAAELAVERAIFDAVARD